MIPNKISEVLQHLEKNGFEALYFEKRQEAEDYILDQIEPGMKVGLGGSMTLKTMDLLNKVEEKGAIGLDHNRLGLTKEEAAEITRQQSESDIFLTSTNALTQKGYLVNCDARGNRVANMIFGPKRAIIVTGKNKICADVEDAMDRIANVAAPPNSKRLKLNNPCVETGRCMDCNSPTRICRAYTILKRKPLAIAMTVVIIGENLGF